MKHCLPLLLLALGGCTTVGPDHLAPQPSPQAAGPFLGGADPLFTAEDGTATAQWWRSYGDLQLTAFVEQALVANKDIAVAAANLARARASLRASRAQRNPTVTASGGASYGRESGAAAGLGESLPTETVLDAGLDASYEIDFVGRVRRLVEASDADFGAAAAALDVARISVAAETARAYFNACSASQQIATQTAVVERLAQSATLTSRTVEAGRGTALDVARAEAVRDTAVSDLPSFRADRDSAIFRLAVLTGRTPSELPSDSLSCQRPPALARPIPIGDGGSLLRRRPDVRQAERELAASTARIGVATADLYPRISLGGSVGATGPTGDIGSSSAFRFSLGPLISWSIPNLSGARARIAEARADAQGSLARFDGVVLAALEETETALALYAREIERRRILGAARDASARAASVAELRFRAGADPFLELLDAQRTLAEADAAVAASDRQIADYQVNVFKALGGGWENAPAIVLPTLAQGNGR